MSTLILSLLIPLAHASNGVVNSNPSPLVDVTPVVSDEPKAISTPTLDPRVAAVLDNWPTDLDEWIDTSISQVRSGICYSQVVETAPCSMPELLLKTMDSEKETQHYQAVLGCATGGQTYVTTELAYEDEIASEGDIFCRDESTVYVVLPAEKTAPAE